MALQEGSDFLFFPKVDITKQSLTGAMTRGCAVLTPDAIYVVPVQSFGSLAIVNLTKKYSFGNKSPVEAVRTILDDPNLDLAGLEDVLTEMLSDDKTRWIFPLDELEKFKMKAGFFGTTTLKMAGESVRRLVIRGKGGKKKAMEFYSDKLAA